MKKHIVLKGRSYFTRLQFFFFFRTFAVTCYREAAEDILWRQNTYVVTFFFLFFIFWFLANGSYHSWMSQHMWSLRLSRYRLFLSGNLTSNARLLIHNFSQSELNKFVTISVARWSLKRAVESQIAYTAVYESTRLAPVVS